MPTGRTIPPLLLVGAGSSALLAAIPLVYLVVRAAQAGPDGFLTVFQRPRVPLLLVGSSVLVLTVTVAAVILGVASALILTRVRLRMQRMLAVIAVLPLAVPSYLAAFGWLAAIPGAKGLWPAWLVLTAVTTPYITLPVMAVLRGTSAHYLDIAHTLGYGPVQAFWRVTWPGIRGATAAGALLVSLYVLSDFGGVALFRYPVFTTAIYQAYGATFDRNYAAVLATILVAIALVIFAGERSLRPRSEFDTDDRGVPASPRSAGVAMLSVSVLILPATAAVAVPLGSLLVRLWSAETVRAVDFPRLWEAVGNTIVLATLGAAIAVILAMTIATLASRYPGSLARLAETFGSLPLALPGIVVGLGLVFFSLRAAPALYQSAAMLAFAYGILFLPKAIGTIRASIDRVPETLEDVARTLGYSPLSRWWRVTARLARPGIIVSALFIAVTAMKELPATLLLRPTGMPTLAVELWAKTDIAAYGAAVPYALALILVAAVPAVLLSPKTERGKLVHV